MFRVFMILIPVLSFSASRIISTQNDDGSYSIGFVSESHGDTGESIMALLSKASGWTENSVDEILDNERRILPSTREIRNAFTHAATELIRRVHLIMKRNSDLMNTVERGFQLITNFFKYVIRIIANAVNKWVNGSSGTRRYGKYYH